MDKLENYRLYIQNLLERHSHFNSHFKSQDDIQSELIFDTVHDRYQLMRIGWKGLKRVYHTVLHFDIKDGKIWLQQNTTDVDVGQELLEFGIPKE
ncbi:MAG: XisI protein [Microcystis aeruginosa G11-01]|nr:XisI protein [Microcystis aeruginosa G11-01]